MKKQIGLFLLGVLSQVGLVSAASGITVISTNNTNGAWVGYQDGSVRLCNGGGGTAVPFWTVCTTAIEARGSAVADISINGQRAWVGYADGQMHYCKESGSDQRPVAECIEVKP
ncbi:MAG: hypothetical protein P1R74_08910 [Sedimenticola sp.]|nr:hypothetical protein [Sedimenticola sp.]